MTDNLEKALDNLQAQIDKEAEAKRQAEEAKRKAEEAKRKAKEEKRKMRERFPEAVKENQIEEVKELMQKIETREKKDIYRWMIGAVPSTEMAEILVDDMRGVLSNKDSYAGATSFMIESSIHQYPEDASKWDKFAKDHDISYDFKTTDTEVLDKVIAQGFSTQCFDFERVAKHYYEAKNGYIGWREIGYDRDEEIWVNQDPQKAAKLKEDLIHVSSCGYQIDLSKKDSNRYLFMRELLKERELQKEGGDKSFIYRDPSEQFYDVATGECNLSTYKLSLILGHFDDFIDGRAKGILKDGFTGVIKGDGCEIRYKNNKRHGVCKTGRLITKYYEDGVDVTEKREALKRIASKRINKEKSQEEKTGKPVIFKKMSKLEKMIAIKKAGKGGRI